MAEITSETYDTLQEISLESVCLERDDIPSMGNILNKLCRLEENSMQIEAPNFLTLIQAVKRCLEQVIMGERDDITVLHEGIELLQSICRSLMNDEEYDGDISSVMEKLGVTTEKEEGSKENAT